MEPILTTAGLSKRYGKATALNELTMHIPKGAIYGLVGKNGAGKTTLIRLLCGLQTPTGGGYTIYGIPHTDKRIAQARRRMGAVVETPSFYPDMSAVDNLKQQCLLLGIPSYEGIEAVLRLVGLADTGRKKARNFSLGMKQRLGIAVALIGNPDLLVLDEPLNGLDPQGIIEMRELILALNRAYGITFLVSCHILDELSKVATHYGFIDKGRIVKEISAEDLHAACRPCMEASVSDTRILARVLDGLRVEYDILSDTEARIFAEIKVTPLVLALNAAGCELVSLHAGGGTLESFYLNLMGGGAL